MNAERCMVSRYVKSASRRHYTDQTILRAGILADARIRRYNHMNAQQILDEYMRAVNDFAQKLNDIDEKHGTYLRLEFIDNESICMTKFSRTIYVCEVVLNRCPS